jgi:DNA-binding response OmpR family regulator
MIKDNFRFIVDQPSSGDRGLIISDVKILVIEDEPEMLGLIKQFLEDENYIVETAENFISGMDKIVSYDYDCILLDIMLPGGNGLDLLQELKNLNKDYE